MNSYTGLPCPKCCAPATKQGTKERRILGIGPHGQPESQTIRVQRWQCSKCAGFFTSGLDSVPARNLSSAEARDQIALGCFRSGFAPAAQRFNVDEKTVRKLW